MQPIECIGFSIVQLSERRTHKPTPLLPLNGAISPHIHFANPAPENLCRTASRDSCALRALKNSSGPITRPPTCSSTNVKYYWNARCCALGCLRSRRAGRHCNKSDLKADQLSRCYLHDVKFSKSGASPSYLIVCANWILAYVQRPFAGYWPSTASQCIFPLMTLGRLIRVRQHRRDPDAAIYVVAESEPTKRSTFSNERSHAPMMTTRIWATSATSY
jgi:hypothetical protein